MALLTGLIDPTSEWFHQADFVFMTSLVRFDRRFESSYGAFIAAVLK